MMGSTVGRRAMPAESFDLCVFALGLGPRCQASESRSSAESTRQVDRQLSQHPYPASVPCLAGISEHATSCQREMQLSAVASSLGDSSDRHAGGSHHLDRRFENAPASRTERRAVIGSSGCKVRTATAPTGDASYWRADTLLLLVVLVS